jgi:hypothetical protein
MHSKYQNIHLIENEKIDGGIKSWIRLLLTNLKVVIGSPAIYGM